MSIKTILLAALALTVMLVGCKKKEDTTIIVEKKQLQAKPQQTIGEMTVFRWSNSVDWTGSKYTIKIERKPDRSLPMAKDESGRKYYDNVIRLTILRADGSKFLDHEFSKEKMRKYVPESMYDTGALLGLVFERAEGSFLYFGTSVGSPDSMSDEYVPLILKIDRQGGMTISKDNNLDGSNSDSDEDEASEEEGV